MNLSRRISRATRRARAGAGSGTFGNCQGVTLVELMVTMTVLLIIMTMLLALTNQTGQVWKGTTAKIEAFQNARLAYQTLTQHLSQATLNTYLDYYDAANQPRNPAAASFVPAYYARNSDLHFTAGQANVLVPSNGQLHPGHAVFFVAPLGITSASTSFSGLPRAMNGCGYYLEFNSDAASVPAFLSTQNLVKPRWRFRLMEFLQPTEQLSIYNLPASGAPSAYQRWFADFLPTSAAAATTAPVRVLAENVVAVIISPQLPPDSSSPAIAPAFTYDTRAGLSTDVNHHQLPQLLRVVIITIDEPSAIRLSQTYGTAPPTPIVQALAGRFTMAAQLDSDIAAVSQSLVTARLTYRIFDSTIALRGAKWSQ